ncbi:hypothetical protein BDF14DRAFT_1885498 [Spinellus fusiger]|nr:hypothetical protein BDF14DRAFT_1885498 [Spinellus fusiger]
MPPICEKTVIEGFKKECPVTICMDPENTTKDYHVLRFNGVNEIQQEPPFIEVSQDKRHVLAYQKKKNTITVHKIEKSELGNVQVQYTGFLIHFLTSMDLPHYFFVSIASGGEYVAVSWSPTQEEQNIASQQSFCCIYKAPHHPSFSLHSTDNGFYTTPYRKIKFQGSCRFLPDNRLALVNLDHIKVYNTAFQFVYLIDLMQLYHSPWKYVPPPAMGTQSPGPRGAHRNHWMPINTTASSLSFMMQCIHRGVLLSYDAEDTLLRLWSVQDGHLIISLKTLCDSSSVFDISSNGGLFAKYTASSRTSAIELFDIESGLLVNKLKLKNKYVHKSLAHVAFMERDHYVVAMSREKPLSRFPNHTSSLSKETVIVIEVWDVTTGVSIAYQETESRPSSENMSMLIGHPSYSGSALLLEFDHSIQLWGRFLCLFPYLNKKNIYKSSNEPKECPWGQQTPIIPNVGKIHQQYDLLESEFHDNHALSSGIASYFLDESNTRVLRIGRYSVQVWLTKKTTKQRHQQSQEYTNPVKQGDIESLRLHKLLYIYCVPLHLSKPKVTLRPTQGRSLGAVCIQWQKNTLRQVYEEDSQVFPPPFLTPTVDFQQGLYRLLVTLDHSKEERKKESEMRNLEHDIELYIPLTSQNASFISLQNITSFFETIAGNQALYQLLRYPEYDTMVSSILDGSVDIKTCFYDVYRKESSLTVAIQYGSTKTIKLLVDYIINASKKTGPGYLVIFMRALPMLCEHCPAEWIRRLSYVPANHTYPLVSRDSPLLPQHNMSTSKEELWSFVMCEQLPMYQGFQQNTWYMLKKYITSFILWKSNKKYYSRNGKPLCKSTKSSDASFFQSNQKPHFATLCVVPLPNYTTYTSNTRLPDKILSNGPPGLTLDYFPSSLFTAQASIGNSEVFKSGEPVMEAMLLYKWHTFAKARFFLIYLIYIGYYALYSINVAFSKEVFGYMEESDSITFVHYLSLVLMMTISVGLVIQETRQIMASPKNYFRLFYNYISLVSVFLPTFAAVIIVSGNECPIELAAISVLILWLHAIVRLRILKEFGIMVEIVVQISKQVFPMFILLIITVFAFTHTFIVLLHNESNDIFSRKYEGLVNSTYPVVITASDDLQENKFQNLSTALKAVWLFIHGDWGAINDRPVENRTLVTILTFILSFTTTFILLNILIALMTDVVDRVKRKGKRVWISYLAESITEIELYWCFPWERRNKRYNPNYIYYVAYNRTVDEYTKSLPE